MQSITQEYLKTRLHYDPVTGVFTWLTPPKTHPRLIGQEAGGKSTGYVMIKIDGQKYKAHRLAWLYERGEPVPMRIDHRDTDALYNAFDNLREATQAQNIANARRKQGKELPKGVRKNRDRFTARITFNGKLMTLGTFDTPREASDSYGDAARRLYGQFARQE